MRRICSLMLMVAPFALLGCGEEPVHPGHDDAGTVGCADDSRVQAWAAGVTQSSSDGTLQVRIVSANPAPPARGTNSWQVQVLDGTGAPLASDDLSLALYMPDHGHGSTSPPTVTADGNGAYSVGNIGLSMPGVWRARFSVTSTGATQLVDFYFCVAG